jgi:hypothetical protein
MRGDTYRSGPLLGLALLPRPDFVIWVVLALVAVAATREHVRMLRVAGVAVAVAAPWFIWATAYYGSPVPHTIPAKALRYPTHLDQLLHGPIPVVSFVWSDLSAATSPGSTSRRSRSGCR